MLLVCKSNLERQCLYNGLVLNGLKLPVETQAAIELADPTDDIAVVLINIGSKRLADPFFSEKLQAVIELWRPVPVVFLAEREEWAQVVRAMEIGARGYIPTSVDIKVCVEAIHLATAGGMYVPASMVFRQHRQILMMMFWASCSQRARSKSSMPSELANRTRSSLLNSV